MGKYPFKFLNAYDQNDTDIFFGRDEEIKALYEMVFQNSILIVYGASGTGKTSLIQCGLAGKFKSYDWLPLIVRRGSNINVSLEKILAQEGGDAAGAEEEVAEPDAKVLTGVPKLIRKVYLNHFKPIYLIFDQFEELYILGDKDKNEETKFIETIKEILASGQTVKLIFSIREEYLGYLYEFERAVPQLLRKKLRVEPMNNEKFAKVLTGINNLKNTNVHFKEDELEPITEGIFNRLKAKENTLTIQLPYLQVFLDKLYMEITHQDETHEKEAIITNKDVEAMGNIGDVLRDFLESQVTSISEKKSSPDKPVSTDTIWKILSPFSTLKGTKQPVLIKDLIDNELKGEADITETLVTECISQEFKNRRILNTTDDQYELTHDSLAKTIAERRTDEQRSLLEIRNLIENQVATSAEVKELFTEKQLNFIEPHLPKLRLNVVENKLIEDSRKAVAKIKNKRKRRNQLIFAVLVFIIGGLIFFSIKLNNSKTYAEEQKRAADSTLAVKENIDFLSLLDRANIIDNAGGKPEQILTDMKALADKYNDSTSWKVKISAIELNNTTKNIK